LKIRQLSGQCGCKVPCRERGLCEQLTHLGHTQLQIDAAQHEHFLAFRGAQIPVLMGLSWEPELAHPKLGEGNATTPLRMENLAVLKFGEHLHWPQGRGEPALLFIRTEETKNESPLEFELPIALSDRLHAFRHEIAPAVIGRHSDGLFISRKGIPRALRTIGLAIEKSVLRHIGVKLTCHQFRHIAAKIHLDANPGAYEVVRQLLGHKDFKTTTRFYAGIDTRRAGRAHADLLARLREAGPKRPRRRLTTRQE
jgi:hypothetical protein